MRVILSVEPVRFPLTGIGRYTYELASRLKDSQVVDDLALFSGTRFLDDLPRVADSAGSAHAVKRLVQKSRIANELYRLLGAWVRGRALRHEQDSLFHGPNFFLPPFPGKKVATFHDLSPFTWPECHDPARVGFLQRELENTLRHADALITDSEYTRQELIRFSGLPGNCIHAVPLAAGPDFYPRSEGAVAPTLTRYGIEYQKYVLYVGTIEPRKNLLVLLEAYERLPERVRAQVPLVLAGYRGWHSDEIHSRIARGQQQGWARYLGYVSVEDLPLLYSGACAFVFPSRYEGFGLPVLEAMASGVPVVCSDSSSLPEVAGDAALIVPSEDVATLSQHISQLIDDQQCREKLVRQSLARARAFSWEQCARGTEMVYQSVMTGMPMSNAGPAQGQSER